MTQAPPSAIDLFRAEAGKLGALADADDLAVGNPDRAIVDQAERIARPRPRSVAMLQSTSSRSHMFVALGERCCYGQSDERLAQSFRADCRHRACDAPVGLVGAPLGRRIGDAGPMRPGAGACCARRLRRIGRYDVETRRELSTQIADRGDVADRRAVDRGGDRPDHPRRGRGERRRHALTLLVGGNNAVTRPGVLGLGLPLDKIGLITLDAHFDMRDTTRG